VKKRKWGVSVDIATIIGFVVAFGLVVAGILQGGSLATFIDPPSLLIVVGGTIGATLVNYSLPQVLGLVGIIKNAFFSQSYNPDKWIEVLVEFAGKSRRDGILSLESSLNEINDDFLKKGIQLAIDGLEPQVIRNILETEIDHIEERHNTGSDICMTMSAFAPALGLIGTLIGLVLMLQNMDDPSSIGPAMAVALLTTFYGAILANLVFTPIAGKLKGKSKDEILTKELLLEGILSITAGDNPRVLEQKLHAFLAPKLRKSSFE